MRRPIPSGEDEMAVLIERATLVVPVAKLEERHPGSTKELSRIVGSRRFCCDDSIAAVAFGTHDGDLASPVSRLLRRAGLAGPRLGYWKDIAVIYEKTASPTLPCDWLHIGRTKDGVVFATVDPDDLAPFEIMVPTNWSLESFLSRKITHVPLDQRDAKFEFVGSDDRADIYRDRESGKEIRAALTRSRVLSAQAEITFPMSDRGLAGDVPFPRYRQMPDHTPQPKEKKPMFDKDGNEIVKVLMGFADYHELDESAEEGDYMEEDVLAVKVGSNRYRLAENPMWNEMAAFHDVVEGKIADDRVFYVERVIEESGLKTIRTGVPPYFYFSDFGKGFLDKVVEAGGMWDILFWGILVFNIPEERAEEFEELFAVACREARMVGQSARATPNQLARRQPSGGSIHEENEN